MFRTSESVTCDNRNWGLIEDSISYGHLKHNFNVFNIRVIRNLWTNLLTGQLKVTHKG
jgi:hypothetical protein